MEKKTKDVQISLEDEIIYDQLIELLKEEINRKLLEEWVDLDIKGKKMRKSCA